MYFLVNGPDGRRPHAHGKPVRRKGRRHRKVTPAQLAALKKGRATLARKRRGLDAPRRRRHVPRRTLSTRRAASVPARSPGQSSGSSAMAHRRRTHRRRATTATRRRRVTHRPRRVRVVVLQNPPRRRHHRGRRVFAMNPHRRRHFRRNLPSVRGLVGGIIQGVYDGAAVVGGQVVTRKVVAALQGVAKMTTPTATQKIGLNLAAAVGVSILAKKALPGRLAGSARFVAAGAFAEALNQTLAQTPLATYLSAFPPRSARIAAYPRRGVSAYPAPVAVRSGVGAYPRMLAMPQTIG